jgi:hypothetical protein
MSKSALLIAILVLAGLGFAYFLTGGRTPPANPNNPTTPAAAAGPLLSFEPASVRSLAIMSATGTRRVERGHAALAPNSSAEWTFTNAGGRSWPAASQPVRSGLRILSTLTPTPAPDIAPQAPIALRIELTDGTAQAMTLSTAPLSGQVLAEAKIGDQPPRRGLIPANVLDMLNDVDAWRDPAALPANWEEVSRIELKGDQTEFRVARVRGGWSLTEPVETPAEPAEIQRLVGTLSMLTIVDFLDASSAAPAATPRAVIALEIDRRDPETKRLTTERVELAVEEATSVAGSRLRARISGVATEPRPVVVDAQPLTQLPSDPLALAARRAVGIPGAEIGQITITRPGLPTLLYKRSLDGWTLGEPNLSRPRTVAATDPVLAGVLGLAINQPATSVRRATSEPPTATLELASLAGTPIATLHVVVASADLVLRAGAVERVYPAADHKALLDAMKSTMP